MSVMAVRIEEKDTKKERVFKLRSIHNLQHQTIGVIVATQNTTEVINHEISIRICSFSGSSIGVHP